MIYILGVFLVFGILLADKISGEIYAFGEVWETPPWWQIMVAALLWPFSLLAFFTFVFWGFTFGRAA